MMELKPAEIAFSLIQLQLEKSQLQEKYNKLAEGAQKLMEDNKRLEAELAAKSSKKKAK